MSRKITRSLSYRKSFRRRRRQTKFWWNSKLNDKCSSVFFFYYFSLANILNFWWKNLKKKHCYFINLMFLIKTFGLILRQRFMKSSWWKHRIKNIDIVLIWCCLKKRIGFIINHPLVCILRGCLMGNKWQKF